MDRREESPLSRGLREAIERSSGPAPRRNELFRAAVRPGASTGRTRHRRYGHILPEPRTLLILQREGEPGFYLEYLDDQGEAQTNTYHDTLDRAFAQAEFEFAIRRNDWLDASQDAHGSMPSLEARSTRREI